MIKRIILPFLIMTLLSSCNKEVQHTFYYTNGKIIIDTNQLKVLDCELNSFLSKEELKENLKIYTSFSFKQKEDFQSISNRYKSYVLDTLKNVYPENVRFLDSLNKINRLSGITIISINNKTGEVENCAFNDGSANTIFENRLEHKAVHPYGYIMTFEKGKDVQDTYAYEINQKLDDRYQMYRNYTVSQSFTVIPGGNIMIRPYYFYPRSDWESINNRLHLNLDLSEFHLGIVPPIKTSLYDLSKTISTIQNKGYYQKPLFIRKVKNSKEKVIYSAPTNQRKRILNELVVFKMKKLFDIYMHGQGMIQYRKNGIIEDCFIYTGGIYEYANWCVYTGQDYTIGIIEYNQLRTNKHDYNINRRRERLKVSIILKDILRTLNQNKTKGKIFIQMNRMGKENNEL
jgi:hypothetical protein